MGRYAKGTSVPVAKTKVEIDGLLWANGAKSAGSYQEEGRAVVVFEMKDRRVQFTMPLPARGDRRFTHDRHGYARAASAAQTAWDQACREKWRSLFITLKAKFVSVEDEVETFEEAFLAKIATPGGGTVGERVLPGLAEAYRTGKLPPLLPSGEPSHG